MSNYTKSCIYKIASKDPAIDDIYIGSTCNVIKRRNQHKYNCNNPNSKDYNMYIYRFIRDNGGWCNWNLYIIEQFNCNTKIQKEQVERSYIEELKPSLNKCIPANFQTGDVYSKSEYGKRYKDQNKGIIIENNKAYREQNKETIRRKQKIYEQKTIHCQYCNHMISLAKRSQHNKTQKHIANSESSLESSSEGEPDTIMDDMTKMRDDSELKLQEIQNTFDEIDKLIH